MLGNSAQAATAKILLNPADAANTAAATSSWIACADAEGAIMFSMQVGAITAGGIVWTIETASDDSGTGGAAITPNEGAFSAVTANTIQKRTIDASASKGYVRCVGTITTGPVQCSAAIAYRPKYVG
jgi:hypothetical protein